MCGRFALTVEPVDLEEAFPEYAFPGAIFPTLQYCPQPTHPGSAQR